MKTNINNYYKNIIKSEYYNSSNFDISSILFNAKINKTFNKLLNLCIKYDIKIFDIDNMNIWYIKSVNNILSIIIDKRNIFTIELSDSIKNLTTIQHQMNFIEIIDNHVNDYKKKIKDFEILFYLFNNIYTDDELKKICNKDNNYVDETFHNNNNNNNDYIKIEEKYNNILKPLTNINKDNINKDNINEKNIKQTYILKPKNNKFIAEYSN